MAASLLRIAGLLRQGAQLRYSGEPVNQLEHALQSAYLAERAGEAPECVAAALLHDLGHLLAAEIDTPQALDAPEDDGHQLLILPLLDGVFPAAVLEPIRLHVDAKRYLCLLEPSYAERLSQASREDLAQQGGVFTEAEAEAFIQRPFAEEAVRLRRYDDQAKVAHRAVPDLTRYLAVLEQVALTTTPLPVDACVAGGQG